LACSLVFIAVGHNVVCETARPTKHFSEEARQKLCFFTNIRKDIGYSLPLILLLFMPFPAPAGSNPSKAQLAAITERGRRLAMYDQAASQATDAVEATHPPEDLVQRYIVHKSDQGWVVDFGQVNETKDKFLVAFEAVQSQASVPFTVKRLEPVREDTGWNLAAAKAIGTALEDFRGPDRPFNVAALPDDSDGLYVYVYPAQVKTDVYPLGADARYHFASNGSLIEKRQLHQGIIEPGPIPADAAPKGGYHTHVLSDLPEDTDVFLVLTRRPRMPEFVGAGKYVYKIDVDGNISIAD
jgi:hypothetical protein